MSDSTFNSVRGYRKFKNRSSFNANLFNLNTSLGLSVLSSLISLSVVLFLVPEQPNQLASICEKYNPVVACSVW